MTNIFSVMDQVNGNSIISIDTETVVKLKGGKKNPFQGRVFKRVLGSNVMVFQNKKVNGYDAMVRRRLEKEGKNPDTFQLSPRTWGTRIAGTPFIEHKGNYYLEVIFLRSGRVVYSVDGEEMTRRDLVDMDIGFDDRPRQEGVQGGLNDKVIIRTYKVDSIKKIRINKNEYEGLYCKM